MKVLTVKQPWASAIITGLKTVENRSWLPNYTGKLLIHAGKTSASVPNELLPLLESLFPLDKLPYGAIIGSVELYDVQAFNWILAEDLLTFGPICWMLKNPIQFENIIPCRGQQRLWNYEGGLPA